MRLAVCAIQAASHAARNYHARFFELMIGAALGYIGGFLFP